jgi:cobalt-zinc-cadmium efflux system outer membrane protein
MVGRGQFLFVCLFELVSAQANAGEPAPPSDPNIQDVTWPELVRLVDAHPRVAASTARMVAARGGVKAAAAVPNPTLDARLGHGSPWGAGDGRVEWGLSLNMPLGWLAQRGPRVESAEAGIAAADAEAQALRRDVLLRLQTLFWNLAFEQARVAALEELEGQTRKLVSTVKRKVETGEVRPVEGIRVEIELEKVAAEVETARTLLGSRQSQLGLWLGRPRVAAKADITVLAPVSHSALNKVRENHPAIAAARARVRALQADLATEERTRIPAFSVVGFASHELDRKSYGAGLAVDLPVWNWNSGRIAQAEATLSASRKEAEAAALDIESNAIEAQAACRASSATASRLGTAVVPRAESSAAIMERTYNLGEASLLDLIDSRRTLLDARRLLLNALAQAQIDCGRLAALTGEDSR